VIVWWATELECISAISRIERAGDLDLPLTDIAFERLEALRTSWQEIEPATPVRVAARRALRVHALRAADALQLAAALVATNGQPSQLPFVTLDGRLADAARREGFSVDPLAEPAP
jgi:predicted nucleic acid-binding protein